MLAWVVLVILAQKVILGIGVEPWVQVNGRVLGKHAGALWLLCQYWQRGEGSLGLCIYCMKSSHPTGTL